MLEKYFQELYSDILEDWDFASGSWDGTESDRVAAEANLELLKKMYQDIFNKEIHCNQF